MKRKAHNLAADAAEAHDARTHVPLGDHVFGFRFQGSGFRVQGVVLRVQPITHNPQPIIPTTP